MALSQEQTAFCATWCASHAATWQVLNRSQWKYEFHPKTLVRYVEESTMRESEVAALLEYLSSDSCMSTLSLYDQDISPEWKPTRAWFETSNRANGNLRGVRLYHGLTTEVGATADGPYIIENGCAYKVTINYYWNQESVETVPQSTSGVSYHITGLQRDTETGRYTYAIEKRERMQQDIPEYLTAKTIYAEHKEEVHLGVKAGQLAATGQQAGVSDGTMVQRKVSKNADCTSDVHNTITIEKPVRGASKSVSAGLTGTTEEVTHRNQSEQEPTRGLDVGTTVINRKTDGGLWDVTIRRLVRGALTWLGETCRKTVFGHTHTKTTVQSDDPGFTHIEAAGNGKTASKQVSRTSDGAYRIEEQETQEESVSDASETVRVGLTGMVRETFKRSMNAKEPTENLGIGESVTNQKTEGGWWNITIRRLVANAMIKIGEACSKTIFQHEHTETKVQSADPGAPNVVSGGGRVRQKQVSRTEDGAYRVTTSETEEQAVGAASIVKRKTIFGIRTRQTDRNQPSGGGDPQQVGDTVTVEKTPGGRVNVTKESGGHDAAGQLVESCQQDYFQHTHTTITNKKNNEAAEKAFIVGKIIRKLCRRREDNLYDVDEHTIEATERIWDYDWQDRRGTHHVKKWRNKSTSGKSLLPSSRKKLTIEFSEIKNNFGKYDGQFFYTTNDNSGQSGSSSFIKHGAQVRLARPLKYKYKMPIYGVKESDASLFTLQAKWHYGDAYTDFVSDWQRADITRTNQGVLAVKKLSDWRDGEGNHLCEWISVEIVSVSPLNNTDGQNCVWSQDDFVDKVRWMFNGVGTTQGIREE